MANSQIQSINPILKTVKEVFGKSYGDTQVARKHLWEMYSECFSKEEFQGTATTIHKANLMTSYKEIDRVLEAIERCQQTGCLDIE